MFTFNSLDWAMGFQWPIIAVFTALMAIGITRLLTMGEEELGQPQGVSSTGSREKRPVRLKSATNRACPAECLTQCVNVMQRPIRAMRRQAGSRRPMTAARAKRG
jgi:hypothetical protein